MKIDKDAKVAYWCRTKDVLKAFLQECSEQDFIFYDKISVSTEPCDRIWEQWKDDIYFYFEKNGTLTFCTKRCVKDDQYVEIDFQTYVIIEYHRDRAVAKKPFEKVLFIEDGSVDLDELKELKETNPEIKVIVYRQGARVPELKEIRK